MQCAQDKTIWQSIISLIDSAIYQICLSPGPPGMPFLSPACEVSPIRPSSWHLITLWHTCRSRTHISRVLLIFHCKTGIQPGCHKTVHWWHNASRAAMTVCLFYVSFQSDEPGSVLTMVMHVLCFSGYFQIFFLRNTSHCHLCWSGLSNSEEGGRYRYCIFL